MMERKRMRQTLVYKRTHSDDPDPATGVFGNKNCMGPIRSWSFDAVIGVGGKGREAESNNIARKLTWIGIGSHKTGDRRCPKVTFDHFRYYGEEGPLLKEVAPALARRMYDKNVRVIKDSLSDEEQLEVENILDTAKDAPHSGHLKNELQPDSKKISGKCRS
jgi:hypothetical protein